MQIEGFELYFICGDAKHFVKTRQVFMLILDNQECYPQICEDS